MLLHGHPLQEPGHEAGQAVHRVVELPRRGPVRAAPPRQVEGECGPTDPLEERLPVLGVARVAVDEDRGRAIPLDPAKEGGDTVHHHGASLDRGHDGGGQYPRFVPLPSKVVLADGRTAELPPSPPPRIPKRDPEWRRPSRRRVLAIRDRLRELYGRPLNQPHGHPIAELVRTVLSQNTNDRNRDVAYNRLRERFPTWEEVRDAPTEEVEEAIKPGGLSVTKAPRIQEILGLLGRPSRPGLAGGGPARGGALLPGRPAGGRPEDRGLRDDLRLRAAGDPGRHPRPSRRRPPRSVPAGGPVRGGSRRDARDHPARGRLRAPHQPDPARARRLPPEAPLRRVRTPPDVPVVRHGPICCAPK